MRAVNLIPPEERRGTGAPTRTGRAPYILLAAMALLIGALALFVKTSGSIADREAEIAGLEVAERDAQARAEALRPFASFASTHEAREATIESLARSRFDWERVVGELSRVMPADIWLSELVATASPEVSIEGGETISLRSDVAGPALELIGCGRSHDSVAGLIAAMEDIDGVTRVTATNSSKEKAAAAAEGSSAAAGAADCQTRSSVAAFELVVAFDEVPVPPTTTAAPVATPVAGASTPAATPPAPAEGTAPVSAPAAQVTP